MGRDAILNRANLGDAISDAFALCHFIYGGEEQSQVERWRSPHRGPFRTCLAMQRNLEYLAIRGG